MARNMNQRRIPGRRDVSPHSDGLAAMGADNGASVALGGPAPLGYASYEAGGPLDSTLQNYGNGAQHQQQQQQHGTDYSSAQSLSAHGSSPGGASPHAPQASFYNASAPTGPTGNYTGVDDSHQAPVRGHHLPPLSEALHSSNDAVQAHDDSHRFAHNVGPGGPAYDDQHFLDAHMMHPPANSNSGAGVHDYSNGANAGATHFQQTANGAPSSAGMMTPPPGSSHGAGSSHGGYQSHYAPPAHMMHRASISGPVMSHYPTHPSVGGATSALAGHSSIGAPPAAGDFAAWGNASGSARPHTADGMFGGQFGLGAPGWPGALPSEQASRFDAANVTDAFTSSQPVPATACAARAHRSAQCLRCPTSLLPASGARRSATWQAQTTLAAGPAAARVPRSARGAATTRSSASTRATSRAAPRATARSTT